MRKLVLLAVCVVATSCLPIHTPELPPIRPGVIGQPISRAAAAADIDTLFRVLEDVHPNLYAVYPHDSSAAERAHVVAELPEQMSRVDFWMRIAPLVAHLGDGHTTVYLPGEEIARVQETGVPQFPAQVAVDDAGHLVITAVLGPGNGAAGLRRGDRLVSLNGHDADSLLRAWMRAFSGESDAFRAGQATANFRVLALAHGLASPFAVDVVGADGVKRSVAVPGITQDSLRAILLRGQLRQASAGAQFVTYRKQQPGVGYLDVRALVAAPDAFARRLTDVFTQAAADSDQALIIDLRTNGGGDSRLADELLRHFNRAPYRMDGGKDWKMSAEYQAHLAEFLSPPLRWLHAWNLSSAGRRMMGAPPGSIITETSQPQAHPSADPFFAGKVCVLTGPGTFSSAADLSDAIKTYHLATLVGEETGGRVNTFGEAYVFRLPQSQLVAQVSSAYFVRASGDTTDHHGVVPDVVVTPTANDRAAGRDAVLDAAIAHCTAR